MASLRRQHAALLLLAAATFTLLITSHGAAAALAAASPGVQGGNTSYTPVDGVFNSTDFNAWLLASAAAGFERMILSPGTYTAPAPTPSTQNAHVFLSGPLSDVVVDMTGVTIIMSSRSDTAVLVTGWTNVTLLGLTSIYATLPSNQARISSISHDGHAFDVVVPSGYPLQDWVAGSIPACNVFQAAGERVWKAGTWDMYPASITTLNVTAGAFRLNFTQALGPAQMNVAVGDSLGCRAGAFAFTFHVSGTENCTFSDITLLGGPGFGYFADGTNAVGARGGNTYRRCAIRVPPPPAGASEAPLIATSADGFHMAGVPWGPLIDSCYFERMTDDGIAIHGSFHVITGLNASSNSVWLVAGDFTPGDTLRVYDTIFAFVGAFTIASVAAASPDYTPPYNTSHTMPSQKLPGARFQVLSFVEPLPSNVTFDFIASDTNRTGNGFQIVNTSIMWHRARGMLIKASSGRIVGNHVMGSTMGALIITPELYWGEADYAHDLWVEGNTFEYVGYGMQSYGGVALGAIDPDAYLAIAGGHTNITFVNNVWRNISYTNLWMSSATGVNVINNTFDVPFVSPQWAQCCEPIPTSMVVFATNVDNVNLTSNCVYAPGPNDGLLNVSATVTGTGLTNGVLLC